MATSSRRADAQDICSRRPVSGNHKMQRDKLHLIASFACIVLLFSLQGCDDGNSVVEMHFRKHEASLVRDAKALIEEAPSERDLPPENIPISLSIPNLKFVETFPTHINLVVYINPDTTRGYRVWVSEDQAGYNDEQTPIPSVTRYSYCDDYPISPENHP